jgi:hypothetical protein
MSHTFFFTLAVSFLLLHEMDAVRCREWRIFPGLSWIKDETLAFRVFVFAHVPLFAGLVYILQSQDKALLTGLNVFFVAHFFLHLLFLLHPRNEFKDWVSWSIITGNGICGACALLV